MNWYQKWKLFYAHKFLFSSTILPNHILQKAGRALLWQRVLTRLGFFSFGGGMSRILLIACRGGSLKKGGSPSIISITIIPNDQISTYKKPHAEHLNFLSKTHNIKIQVIIKDFPREKISDWPLAHTVTLRWPQGPSNRGSPPMIFFWEVLESLVHKIQSQRASPKY